MIAGAWNVLTSGGDDREYIVSNDGRSIVSLLDKGYKLIEDVQIQMIVMARLSDVIVHSDTRVETEDVKIVDDRGIPGTMTIVRYRTQYWHVTYYKTGIRANCWAIWSLLFPIALGIQHKDNDKQ